MNWLRAIISTVLVPCAVSRSLESRSYAVGYAEIPTTRQVISDTFCKNWPYRCTFLDELAIRNQIRNLRWPPNSRSPGLVLVSYFKRIYESIRRTCSMLHNLTSPCASPSSTGLTLRVSSSVKHSNTCSSTGRRASAIATPSTPSRNWCRTAYQVSAVIRKARKKTRRAIIEEMLCRMR